MYIYIYILYDYIYIYGHSNPKVVITDAKICSPEVAVSMGKAMSLVVRYGSVVWVIERRHAVPPQPCSISWPLFPEELLQLLLEVSCAHHGTSKQLEQLVQTSTSGADGQIPLRTGSVLPELLDKHLAVGCQALVIILRSVPPANVETFSSGSESCTCILQDIPHKKRKELITCHHVFKVPRQPLSNPISPPVDRLVQGTPMPICPKPCPGM